jgi:hypothetical protein
LCADIHNYQKGEVTISKGKKENKHQKLTSFKNKISRRINNNNIIAKLHKIYDIDYLLNDIKQCNNKLFQSKCCTIS